VELRVRTAETTETGRPVPTRFGVVVVATDRRGAVFHSSGWDERQVGMANASQLRRVPATQVVPGRLGDSVGECRLGR
jgi:hypothetical protein